MPHPYIAYRWKSGSEKCPHPPVVWECREAGEKTSNRFIMLRNWLQPPQALLPWPSSLEVGWEERR